MPLNIKNEITHQKAKELSVLTGKSISSAVAHAIDEALKQAKKQQARHLDKLERDLEEIIKSTASLPVKDDRPADQIIGYDEKGIPR
jgi:antitoxin VapB